MGSLRESGFLGWLGGKLNTPRMKLTVLAVGFTVAVAALYLIQPPVLHDFLLSLEDRLLDLRFQLRGVQKPQTPVVMAVLDEKSLDRVGRWPWPRPVVASFLRALGNSGAAVAGLDMGFFEEDAPLALKFIQEEKAKSGPQEQAVLPVLDRLARRLSGDALLGEAILRSPTPMVAGYFMHMTGDEVKYISATERRLRQKVVADARYRFITLPDGVHESGLPLPEAYMVEPNIPSVNKAASFMGYFNMLPDPDGKIRGVPLVIRLRHQESAGKSGQVRFDYAMPLIMSMLKAYAGGDIYAQQLKIKATRAGLAQALAKGQVSQADAVAYGKELDKVERETKAAWGTKEPSLDMGPAGVRSVRMGKWSLDTEPTGELRLNYYGPKQSFPYYSWCDILEGKLNPPDALKGKLVIVGSSAVGVGDVRATPFDPMLPGPEIHATALDNILSGYWLKRPDWAKGVNLLTILVLGLLSAFLLPRVSAPVGGCFFLLMLAGFVSFNHFYAFAQKRWVLGAVYPLITLTVIFVAVTVLRFILEERERRKTRRAFSFYLSEKVIEQVLKNPSLLQLGGQRRELSIFFSDLQGFTSISESLDPVQLTTLLNEYLSAMTDIILDEGGTLDKYEGDAIIAFWNAPLEQPDHALRACRAALRCQRKLAELRPVFREKVAKDLFMRVGINSGPVVVGNMGSSKRFDYTFLGDAGNLASRLEGANKVFGTYFMVSENTWSQVREQMVGRELGSLVVVGKKQAVKVFEPLAMAGEDGVKDYGPFLKGLEMCRRGDWKGAQEAFEAQPDDPASLSYLDRLKTLAEGYENWDGIWNLTSK